MKDAAVELFLEHGFENVTVSDITRTRRAAPAHPVGCHGDRVADRG
ncbi:TetR family transcriptional regulator [Prauserella sp. PE36]